MKNAAVFSLFLILFAACKPSRAQNTFAPLGAEWWYQGDNFDYTSWTGGLKPNKTWTDHLLVSKDTIISETSCRQITVNRTYKDGDYPDSLFVEDPKYLYVYDNTDTVFIYSESMEVFMPLYVFNVKVGDVINIPRPHAISAKDSLFLIVEAVKWEDFGGQSLKSVYTKAYKYMVSNGGTEYTYNYGSLRGLHDLESTGRYTQRLGMTVPRTSGLYPDFTISVEDAILGYESPTGNLVCYKDSDYNFRLSQADCNYLPGPVSVEKLLKQNMPFVISPNPARDQVMIAASSPMQNGTFVAIYDLSGRIVLPLKNLPAQQSLIMDIHLLPEGLYVMRVEGPDQFGCQKLVIQR